MRMFTLFFVLLLSAATAQDAKHEYVGINGCKACHMSKKKGDIYNIWKGTAHATTYETLLSDKAKEIAKKRGLKEAPQLSGDCLVCHTTGWGDPSGYKLLSEAFAADPANASAVKRNKGLENVGCEVCHGPGNDYKSKDTMLQIFNKEIEGASVGLTVPTEKTCKTCHNEKSPNFKGFDFKAMVAKIAHPYPEEMPK